ncbi:MAG: hypothetical protein IJW14_01360 [Oscillospiraceae bacterium]|nr:hypothetical protein [Oscillospiraceae bacterium]
MMTYEKAELELIRFAAEDVLATSPASEAPVETTKCSGEDAELPAVEF